MYHHSKANIYKRREFIIDNAKSCFGNLKKIAIYTLTVYNVNQVFKPSVDCSSKGTSGRYKKGIS